MSPLATRPGRNAARQAKKLSEIRHVKGAIRWAERTRKERQKKALERLEHKQMHIGAMRWEWQNVTSVRQRALRNAREDWMLGPLRPNRAIGAGREKYGALNARHAQKAIQEPRVLARENDQREKRGQEVKYPLIVDEKKYFPIVAGDRVTVVRGRSAGCVGIVRDVVGKTHDVVIDNVNKVRTPRAPAIPSH
jgi:large subunit ribosomal protein L24